MTDRWSLYVKRIDSNEEIGFNAINVEYEVEQPEQPLHHGALTFLLPAGPPTINLRAALIMPVSPREENRLLRELLGINNICRIRIVGPNSGPINIPNAVMISMQTTNYEGGLTIVETHWRAYNSTNLPRVRRNPQVLDTIQKLDWRRYGF